jgi:cyclic beta-1,2-glucan synthetase
MIGDFIPEGGVAKEMPQAGLEPVGLPNTANAALREQGRKLAEGWKNLPHHPKSRPLRSRFEKSVGVLAGLQHELQTRKYEALSDDLKWLSDHLRLFAADIVEIRATMRKLQKLPLVRSGEFAELPRSWVLMHGFMEATQYEATEEALMAFVEGAEEVEPLEYKELWALGQMLKLVLFEETGRRGQAAFQELGRGTSAPRSFQMDRVIKSLQLVGEMDWEQLVEPLSPVNRIFHDDPAGVYSRMDDITRGLYLTEISDLAKRSHATEVQIARLALQMAAEEPVSDPSDREASRRRHVGYYLIGPGAAIFRDRVGFRPTFDSWLQQFIRKYPDEFYIIGIEFISLATVAGIILPYSHGRQSLGMLLICALLLLIPATQAAVELVNYFITSVLRPKPLPKLDFTEGVSDDCKTLVAVPTLLINDRQIRQLIEDLEVRYLGNQDPNIHYALLTDLPDTAEEAEEQDARIGLATQLIEELNRKYAHLGQGQFYLFHRHRIYNPQEGAWMGWERKRGKLLDLNKLLRDAFDPFPVKVGDMSALTNVRYVITLDSDTQLPRGSAARMIATMAHLLNCAVIDPKRNVVTEGYGILQPRVGISVQSAGRSRLAALYSGQTGFDIYTRAVSDIYQDLYGEGIFTGKGIYEVDALRQVLELRFPRNTLLSHDLIEGAYARAGLLSDVEVIDDYPSHYSAYNRRKHRWLRGDWQIARWLFKWVPDEAGRLVRNPISLISRWKIFDNLRRSLVEPATFVLFLAGWLFLPGGPASWTCFIAGLLFLPGLFQFLFGLFRFLRLREYSVLRETGTTLVTSLATVMLNIVFLAHQAMVALDAIIRTVVRSNITKRSLLEWETATEAELGLKKRTPVDVYLNWMPLVAIVLGGLIYLLRPAALFYAIPVLLLWACSKLVSNWLNRPPLVKVYQLGSAERHLAKETFLKTWRFFAEFSNKSNNWLMPDNVQETPFMLAERISPTNLGLLLNARQAAQVLGYLTVPESADLTGKTLVSMLQLPRYRGQVFNWYDNLTLKALDPLFVSTVDSGNLVASLWSLKQGLLSDVIQPILRPVLYSALLIQVKMLRRMRSVKRREVVQMQSFAALGDGWVTAVLKMPDHWPLSGKAGRRQPEEAAWWTSEARRRVQALRKLAEDYAPWLLPEFEDLQAEPQLKLKSTLAGLTPGAAGEFYRQLDIQLQEAGRAIGNGATLDALLRLRQLLPDCRRNAEALALELKRLAAVAERYSEEMRFDFLFDNRRKLLTIGYDVGREKVEASCYDLMASEARIAAFVAIAKGEIPQDSWFKLGRTHTMWEGQTVLTSWTGTMFEYLMPALWLDLWPNTLLDRSARAAVRVQQTYAGWYHVPWGISESGWSERNAEGHYQYHAFGVPTIALKNPTETARLVISPYSAWLALTVDPEGALSNVSRMAKLGWNSKFGFYEAADYGVRPSRWNRWKKPVVVRMWMAHHQGMTLLSLANWLGDNPFTTWFHCDPRVQATELLLQEKPLRTKPLPSVRPDLARLAHVHRWKAAV